MKENRISYGRNRKILAVITIAVLLAAAIGLRFGYNGLRQVYQEQCVIRDMSAQVEITSGKMVHPGTIAEEFGLKVGKNLATIDFDRKRKEVLSKIPNLRTIRVTRKLPDKVIISAEERTPIAKMGIRGLRKATGRVVDTEGVVFLCQRGTQMLPTILEPASPGTRPGQRILHRTLAALKLIEACREPEFLELGVLEVDTAKHDFLTVTLGNYSKVKILWDEMDESTVRAHKDLVTRLTQLRNAIRSQVTPETVIWNATIPGQIFADTQGKL